MDNLGDKVLRKIKEEHIAPKPRWQFLLKDYFIWFLFFHYVIPDIIVFKPFFPFYFMENKKIMIICRGVIVDGDKMLLVENKKNENPAIIINGTNIQNKKKKKPRKKTKF